MVEMNIPDPETGGMIPESLKLTRTTKGYTWQIKINSLDVKKLEALDKELAERWGDGKN